MIGGRRWLGYTWLGGIAAALVLIAAPAALASGLTPQGIVGPVVSKVAGQPPC